MMSVEPQTVSLSVITYQSCRVVKVRIMFGLIFRAQVYLFRSAFIISPKGFRLGMFTAEPVFVDRLRIICSRLRKMVVLCVYCQSTLLPVSEE